MHVDRSLRLLFEPPTHRIASQTHLRIWLCLPVMTPKPTTEAQTQSLPRGRIPGYGRPVPRHPYPSGWVTLEMALPLC